MLKNKFNIVIFLMVNIFFISCGGSTYTPKGDNNSIGSYSESKAYNLWEYLTPSDSKLVNVVEVDVEIFNGEEIVISSNRVAKEEIQVISDKKVVSRNGDIVENIILKDDNILIEEYNNNSADLEYYSLIFSKSANIGDTISTKQDMGSSGLSISNQKCILTNFFSNKKIYNREFTDILEITCIADIRYNNFIHKEVTKIYLKKGYGQVAYVDRNCIINDFYVDDNSTNCQKETFQYKFYD